MTIDQLQELCDKATEGPWFVNGLDIESSHVVVAEGEEAVQLYDTDTGKPTRKIKPHQEREDDDTVILTTSSILGDRPFEEALATAEFITAARTYLPKLLAVARAAKHFALTPSMEPWDEQTEDDFRPLVEALAALEG